MTKAILKNMHFSLPSRLQSLAKVEHIVHRIAAAMDLSSDEHDNLAISVTEAVGNAIVHGNKKDPAKRVTVDALMESDRVHITVTDQGSGFDPNVLQNPLEPQNLMKESGRGIFILKNLMDAVDFEISEHGTAIRMTLVKKGPSP